MQLSTLGLIIFILLSKEIIMRAVVRQGNNQKKLQLLLPVSHNKRTPQNIPLPKIPAALYWKQQVHTADGGCTRKQQMQHAIYISIGQCLIYFQN